MADGNILGSNKMDAKQDGDLVASAMTRQLSVSLGRPIILDELSENYPKNETLVVNSPHNGDVDVVTVDNNPEATRAISAEKNSPVSHHKDASPTKSSKSMWITCTSPRSIHSSPGRGDLPTANKNRRFEACILNKAKVWLPLEMIEQPKIFNEVVSLETWNSVLSEEERERLFKMMPKFPEADAEEKSETLRRLFAGKNFKFGNPVRKLQKDLRAGFFSLEVFKHKRALRRAKYREYKHRQELRCHRMLKEVLISRQELLEAAQFTAPDEPFKVKRPRPLTIQNNLDERVAKKYRKILKECRIECGDMYTSDEDDDTSLQKDKTPTKKCSTPWYQAPSDIVLPTLSLRVQSTFDPKPIKMQHPSRPDGAESSNDEEMVLTNAPDSPLQLSETAYMEMVDKHQQRRASGMDHFELDASNITLEDIKMRTFSVQNSPTVPLRDFYGKSSELTQKRKTKPKDKLAKKRKKGRPTKVTTPISVGSIDSKASLATVESSGSMSTNQEEPSIPVDVTKEEDTKIQSFPKSTIYPNFFSFLRDMLKQSPDCHLTQTELQARTEKWQKEPVSAFNVWFMLMPSWAKVISSMLKFLIGELPSMPIKSPMVEYMETKQAWRWIGEGKDSDEQLTILFKQWLTAVMEDKPAVPEIDGQASPTVPSPIKVRTDYIVRPSTAEEKAIFRAQEHERYEEPHKAYTYCVHGYKSVVGPVKGVYSKEMSLNKAREHSLLVSDRPPYVTILSLVRDAVARLPNGEGTRSEVCELLKDSKFLADATDHQINTVVSGALDRLHYEKDPCVKYDGNRKLWIYLHRNRSEEEFERLHLEQAVSFKAKRTIQKQPKPLQKGKPVLKDMQVVQQIVRPPSAMSDTSNDSIISVGVGLETPSPSRSPGSSSLSPHSFAKCPPTCTSHNPGEVIPGVSHKVTKIGGIPLSQVLQGHLSSPAGISGSHVYSPQVQALLSHSAVPSILVPTSMGNSEGVQHQSVNSLIKAQLLAPRGLVAQLASQQYGMSPPKAGQFVQTTTGTAHMPNLQAASLLMSQLRPHQEQSPHASSESPQKTKLDSSSTTSDVTPSSSQAITLTLTGATTVADKSKVHSANTIPAALAFHTDSMTKPSTLPVNVTLTLKGTSEEKKPAAVQRSRGQGGKTKLPTVGGLLAGLGVPLEGLSMPRGGRKGSTAVSKSKSPTSAQASRVKSPVSAQEVSQSSTSRKKSQQSYAPVSQDCGITLQTLSSLAQAGEGPVLAYSQSLTSASAGIQPSGSGLVVESYIEQQSQCAADGSKTTPIAKTAQVSAVCSQNPQALQPPIPVEQTSSQGMQAGMSCSNDGKLLPAKPDLSSVQMSVLMASLGSQGPKPVSVAGSPGRSASKPTIPVITSPLLSTGIPGSLAPGKGVILQVPSGSKFVSAIPATVSRQKSTAPVILTTSSLTSSLMTPMITQGSGTTATSQPDNPQERSQEVLSNKDSKNMDTIKS